MMELERHITINLSVIQSPNLCDRFTDRDLQTIADQVVTGHAADEFSRTNWMKRMEAALDLALQVTQGKSFPWPNCSNVAFPLITIAALQFHSRAYPSLVSGTDLVKCRVFGPDPDGKKLEKAERISQGMSYQLLEQDQGWEEAQDRALIITPIVGCCFKKSFYNDTLGHNVSDLVFPKDLVIDYYAKSVESARRKTHVIQKYRNEIHEKIMLGAYRNVREMAWYKGEATSQTSQQPKDNRTGQMNPGGDSDTPFTFLEQHCWLDLDGDGYSEPYTVLVDKASSTTMRITARYDREEDITRLPNGKIVSIRATEHFTKYELLPSPDGGIYGLGFGTLLGPLNETVNTLINQLLDAGTMKTLGGGFLGRGAKIRGGAYTFKPFEWKRVDSTGDDLRKNIVPLEVGEPSNVLFQLLGLLIDYTNRIAGATETLAGQNPGQNTPATTTNTMVEQGLKIYSAIYKRIWRSMKGEFRKLFVLNGIYLPPQSQAGGAGFLFREDYLGDPNQIAPAADPNIVSDSMRIAQANLLSQRSASVPGYDVAKVEQHLLRTMRIDGWESFYPGPQKTGPLPNPKVKLQELKNDIEMKKLAQKKDEFIIEMMEQHDLQEAQIAKLEAEAKKLLAEANGVDVGHQIAMIDSMIAVQKQHSDKLFSHLELMLKEREIESRNQGRGIQGLEGPSGNQSANGAPAGGAGGAGAGMA